MAEDWPIYELRGYFLAGRVKCLCSSVEILVTRGGGEREKKNKGLGVQCSNKDQRSSQGSANQKKEQQQKAELFRRE